MVSSFMKYLTLILLEVSFKTEINTVMYFLMSILNCFILTVVVGRAEKHSALFMSMRMP